jgi:hypothetical protein
MVEPATDQLKLLSDYTLFHIGLYTTLITALVALAHFRGKKFEDRRFGFLVFTVISFLVAGAAGGAIASNIPNYPCFKDYDQVRLDVFGVSTMTYRSWAHVEHIAFWIGIIVAVIGFLWPSHKDGSGHAAD